MCRWLAYSGEAVPLELFLFQAEHSRIDQGMSSRSAETPTNRDGFGVGWYSWFRRRSARSTWDRASRWCKASGRRRSRS